MREVRLPQPPGMRLGGGLHVLQVGAGDAVS